MAGSTGPDKTGNPGSGNAGDKGLEERRRRLETALSASRGGEPEKDVEGRSGKAGFATALRLSSEFVAGILVGAGIGWLIDRFAGTSPWGLIVFLLLGFAAGVLNVLRSAGLVADVGSNVPDKGTGGRED